MQSSAGPESGGPCRDSRIQHPTGHGAKGTAAGHDTETHRQAKVEVLPRLSGREHGHRGAREDNIG